MPARELKGEDGKVHFVQKMKEKSSGSEIIPKTLHRL